ncbi:MAG: antibiotic biosynthesis monooxygenase [Synechococcales bacterium]|nr:antibiotic biosynthesis monooxygenase [Synechococcales bacterium]
MNDFQDCLMHRVAHVTIGEFKTGKFEEAQALYQEAIATYGEGFRGAYLLREPGSDRGMSVIFWDSADQMAASDSTQLQQILKHMAPLFASHPTSTDYEVVTECEPSSLAPVLVN